MRGFDTVIQFLASSKTITTILFLVLLTGGILTTVILTGQTQDVRQRAGNTSEPNSCQDCKNLDLNNAYFCRNAKGQTDCQPKDISEALPGSICIDCSMVEADVKEKKNPIQVWWETVLDAINPDLNRDGKIDGSDAMEIYTDFKGGNK